jgi:hypothetical protein
VQGLFSKEDHTNSSALACCIHCTIFCPSSLVINQCGSKLTGLIKNASEQMAIKFRMQCAHSSDLIETCKQLGFMAMTPNDMKTWSKKLFKLVTVSFYEVNEFKKATTSKSCTCSNIHVLAAILVFLVKEEVINTDVNLDNWVRKAFNNKGMCKITSHWINKGWSDGDVKRTWAGTIQTKFRVRGGL